MKVVKFEDVEIIEQINSRVMKARELGKDSRILDDMEWLINKLMWAFKKLEE